jgi:hypothetical protein
VASPNPDVIRGREVGIAVPTTGLPPAEAANVFHCTRVNGDVEVLIGTVPLFAMFQGLKQQAEGRAEITAEITHRLLMSIDAFGRLRSQVNELFEKLPDEMKAHVEAVGGR